MQRTTEEMIVHVGEDKTPIRLTDSAVEAVQNEASGRLTEQLDEILDAYQAHAGALTDMDGARLLDLRDSLQTALEMTNVLMDCRPLDEFVSDESAAE